MGRSREMRDILNRVQNGNSVSIVGERRIGKSSLIYHIFLTGNRQLNDDHGAAYRFIYLDFHNAQLKHPASFAGKVLQEMDLAFDREALLAAPMVVLGHQLEGYRQSRGPKPILLLDEFEEITQHKELANDDFLEALRSFCNSGLLTLVTVSRNSLKKITDTQGLTSPFWNIFLQKELGAFHVDRQLDEVALFLEKYWGSPEPWQGKEGRLFASFDTRHPLVLQVICYHIWENRIDGYSHRQLKMAIRTELRSYFRSGLEKRRKWVLRTVPGAVSRAWRVLLQPLKEAIGIYKSAKGHDK